jgi:hypothetical protein
MAGGLVQQFFDFLADHRNLYFSGGDGHRQALARVDGNGQIFNCDPPDLEPINAFVEIGIFHSGTASDRTRSRMYQCSALSVTTSTLQPRRSSKS